MKKIKYFISILLLALVSILYNSCETDFDVIADYEDITVVYVLLDPNETTHYVKINKAFLGEGNALIMAQNPDSCNYEIANLDVKMEEWNDNNLIRTFYLDTTTIYNKESGTFYSPQQVLFKSDDSLNCENTYKIIITNKKSGKIVYAETPIVYPVSLEKPNAGQTTVDYTSDSPTEVLWLSAKYARIYQLQIKFNYKEIDVTTNDTTYHCVNWDFPVMKSSDLNGGDNMITSYYGATFFQLLADNIPHKPNVKRHDIAKGISYTVFNGGDDLSIYIDLNKPSNTIVQERPEYTNVNNGIGLVSSRSAKTQYYSINSNTRKELVEGTTTSSLNFKYN